MFGNRDILRWESKRDLERKLMIESNIRKPMKYKDPSQIDRTVIVKFPGARSGRGYLVSSYNRRVPPELILSRKEVDWRKRC